MTYPTRARADTYAWLYAHPETLVRLVFSTPMEAEVITAPVSWARMCQWACDRRSRYLATDRLPDGRAPHVAPFILRERVEIARREPA